MKLAILDGIAKDKVLLLSWIYYSSVIFQTSHMESARYVRTFVKKFIPPEIKKCM
jgi:hypothetical protein